jgi:asparagine synthase (glutamine-hydrolysing)
MSGICGIFGTPPTIVNDHLISSMLQSLRHRGPDGVKVYTSREAGAAMGEVHLNSFGAPLHGATPTLANTDDVVLAIDGSVINRREVLGKSSGQPTVENLDAQAVVAAYRERGDAFLSLLDGPFTLALLDKNKNRLFLSRDRLGERSLYYWVDPLKKTLIFASEIKAILTNPGARADLDLDNLSLYFAFGYIPGPGTLFKGIFKLLPGEALQWNMANAPQKQKYWRLPGIDDGLDDEAYCIRRLRELFMQGLERYVDGAQEVAVFLSGGVDSSIIVAGLRELGVPRISTFTISFNVDSANPQDHEDFEYARLVAKRFNTTHREVIIEKGHKLGDRLLQVIKQYDDLVMTPNSYSKCLLTEAVREAGIKSVLTGSAAAGACGVHRKFLDAKKREKLLKKTRECATDEERYYLLRSRLFDLEEQQQFMRHGPRLEKQDILNTLHHYIGDIQSTDFFRLFLFSNLMITSTEKSLKVLDKSGIMNSVEVRSPYLDRALVEFSTQLPSSFDGVSYVSLKTHLKKAFENILPREVLERTVIGYPSYYWHNGELGEFQKRVLNREGIERQGIFQYEAIKRILEEEKTSGAKSFGKHGWAFTQFCLWYEIHINQNSEFLG